MEKLSSKWDSGKNFVGVILVGIGIIFLLSNWGIIPSLGKTWPLILIIVGLAFLLGFGEKEEDTVIPPSESKEQKDI